MKTWQKVTLITLPFAVITFALGPLLWTAAPEFAPPTPAQLPFLIVLSAIESVAFGLGLAFLFLGWPLVRSLSPHHKGLAMATHLSLVWLLVSWWPHDNMHKANGGDIAGLILIDYEFHFTLIAATLIIAYFFYTLLKSGVLHAPRH